MTLKERYLLSDFCRIFNFRAEVHRGRTYLLICQILAHIANALTTGALYTAFLAENGIDIVRVGIISFIPYISWTLSVFSPMIMARFKKRQIILMINDVIYYGCLILATTIMPLFVEDPAAKTIWFAVLLFIGNASNALLGSGYTTWHLRFIPEGRDLNAYVAYNNVFSQVLNCLTSIVASVAATALAANAHQMTFLFWLRIGAFLLFMIGSSLIYLCQREVPTKVVTTHVSPLHLITEPVRHKPFLMVALITILWNICCGINSNTYNYYMLETVGAPMAVLYVGSVASMLGGLFLTRPFRRIVDRTSPYFMVALFTLLFALLEFPYMFVDEQGVPLYCVLAALSGLLGVGFSMGFNSFFYLHLPEDSNKDLFSTFWNLVSNLALLLGSAGGTWILAAMETHGSYLILGRSFYPSQLLILVKVACFLVTFLFTRRVTPYLLRCRK